MKFPVGCVPLVSVVPGGVRSQWRMVPGVTVGRYYLPVDRQTPVKTLPSRNFVCRLTTFA